MAVAAVLVTLVIWLPPALQNYEISRSVRIQNVTWSTVGNSQGLVSGNPCFDACPLVYSPGQTFDYVLVVADDGYFNSSLRLTLTSIIIFPPFTLAGIEMTIPVPLVPGSMGVGLTVVAPSQAGSYVMQGAIGVSS